MFPDYFDPAQTGQLWIERGAEVAAAVAARQRLAPVAAAACDTRRIAVVGIDCQVGFVTPGASLQVPGAVADMNRAIHFIYTHAAQITRLYFSLDTHYAYQIFHPAFWQDAQGQAPAPFSIITAADVRAGRWRAHTQPEQALAYCEALERDGRKQLIIWPYHTLLGGLSHALVPALQEAAMYHTLLRASPSCYVLKGEHPWTESYSVFEPEVKQLGATTLGAFNAELFQALLAYDRVYLFGEASSHCVPETVASLVRQMQIVAPDAVRRLYLLVDCMSPVPKIGAGPDFPAYAEATLAEFAAQGVQLVRSTDPL